MKLYVELFKALFKKIRGKKNGEIIRDLATNMGVVYIKLAQILSTHNYGNLFTEEDRKLLSGICDDINILDFNDIQDTLNKEYNDKTYEIFSEIEEKPVGSASISQVHKAKLKTGEVVAIKIKRKDITDTMEKDIKQLEKLMYRYGKFVKFGNYSAGSKALNLYLDWIKEETDFINEVNNIKLYQNFANDVNGKIKDNLYIIVPKVYESLCTENIIVMEYIPYKTINKLDDTIETKEKIKNAMNSYIKSNFYALFNDKTIVYHADPHEGNIFLDENGNVGFLDMGLCYKLTEEDTKTIKKFFFSVFTGNYEELYDYFNDYCKLMSDKKKQLFKEDLRKYCIDVKTKEVTNYFTDVIFICLKYEFMPPKFLFIMAKTFMMLNGICGISDNKIPATELLMEQTIEYCLKSNVNQVENLVKDTAKLTPKLIRKSFKTGLINAAVKNVDDIYKLYEDFEEILNSQKQLLSIIKNQKGTLTKTLNL